MSALDFPFNKHAAGGGPMTKPVGGNAWQAPNKPAGSLDERVPELRRPSSLSPLRARRRSVVSVLTGEWGSDKAQLVSAFEFFL